MVIKDKVKLYPFNFLLFVTFYYYFCNISFCYFQELVLGSHILSVGVTTPKGQNIKDTVQASHRQGNKHCFFYLLKERKQKHNRSSLASIFIK